MAPGLRRPSRFGHNGVPGLDSAGGVPRPVDQALDLGDEILRLLRPPLSEEGLGRLEALLAERESILKLAMEATASDPVANGPDPDTFRRLVAQQRALEDQTRRLLANLQETSGEMQAARNKAQAVNRILNPGVRPRWVNEIR